MDASTSQIPPSNDNVGPSTPTDTTGICGGKNKGGTASRKSGKKRHHREREDSAEPIEETITGPCKILTLPLELLAEILSNTHSPASVLAVARCSKSLCATLLSPTSNYIWRSVRKSYACPVPNPCEIFSEAGYAAFIFDGGVCEVCNRNTDCMYTSFSLRLRLCRDSGCLKNFIEKCSSRPGKFSDPDRVIMQWISVVETETCLDRYTSINYYWPHVEHIPICRLSTWSEALMDYNIHIAEPNYLANKATAISNNTKWMQFCVSLYRWKIQHKLKYDRIKLENEQSSKIFAESNGWNYKDMMNCTPYGKFQRDKIRLLEIIEQSDRYMYHPLVEADLLKLADRRKRSALAAAQRANRADIDTHYMRVRSSRTLPTLPPLHVFRKLPVLSLLQSSEHTGVGKTLAAASGSGSAGFVGRVLDEQLRGWVNEAREGLAEVLGCKGWKSANSKQVHPVERLTARFRCKVCRGVGLKYTEDECLDFRGVCAHECMLKGNGGKKGKEKPRWNKDMFERDEQAIVATKSLLSLFGENERFTTSFDPPKDHWVLCSACSPSMVLHPKSVIGHSHRHCTGTMTLQILLPKEVGQYMGLAKPMLVPPTSCAKSGGTTAATIDLFNQLPSGQLLAFSQKAVSGTVIESAQVPSSGLVQKLLTPGLKARKVQEQKVFGCRHCLRAQQKVQKEIDKEMTASAVEETDDGSAERSSAGDREKDGEKDEGAGEKEEKGKGQGMEGEDDKEKEKGTGEIKNSDKEKQESKNNKTEKLHLFIWNGMRSHLKEKHKLENIRDEDFFTIVPLGL